MGFIMMALAIRKQLRLKIQPLFLSKSRLLKNIPLILLNPSVVRLYMCKHLEPVYYTVYPPKKYLTRYWFVKWATYEGSKLFQIESKSLIDPLKNLRKSPIPQTSKWSVTLFWIHRIINRLQTLLLQPQPTQIMSKRSLLMGPAGRIKNPFTIVVAETFNTTHRIRSYDPMALRLIQKVSVLFSLRHSLAAVASSEPQTQPTTLPKKLSRLRRHLCI